MKDIQKYWPLKNSPIRKSQIEVFDWIEQLPSNIKYILCEMPVGGGKSNIGVTYSAFLNKGFGNSYILTPQKILQNQYESSFDKQFIFSLYGRANYPCVNKQTNCDIGSIINPKCENCEYSIQFGKANCSSNLVLNYKLGLLLFKYVSTEKTMQKRKLIVFDECHTLENHLTEFNAIQIGEKRCKQFNTKWVKHSSSKEAFDWIKNTYMPAVIDLKKKLSKLYEDINAESLFESTLSKENMEIMVKYKDVQNHYENISEFLLLGFENVENRYVFITDKSFFRYKELYGKNAFKNIIEPMADKFLFMSSTILDKDAYCEDLGIDPKQAAFISVDSEFKLENRPVIYTPRMKMTYGWDSEEKKHERKDMLDCMVDILNTHKTENGIIHTASFQIAKWIIDNIDGKIPHRILHHMPESDYDRDRVISEFTGNDDEPKVLISPSITEGLDLVGDKARFAIIAKVPYPYLRDAWVKRRQELSREWYMRQAIIGIIQGGGRIVRSKEDWGNVYILDESFGMLIKMMKKHLPKWWVDSIQTM